VPAKLKRYKSTIQKIVIVDPDPLRGHRHSLTVRRGSVSKRLRTRESNGSDDILEVGKQKGGCVVRTSYHQVLRVFRLLDWLVPRAIIEDQRYQYQKDYHQEHLYSYISKDESDVGETIHV